MKVDRPIRFAGTPEERLANYDSHNWGSFDGENFACGRCDVKPHYESANYPCGAEVPREVVEIG